MTHSSCLIDGSLYSCILIHLHTILLPLLLGVKPDVMLYNALLSVYIQNNHNFNPLDVLEKMEKNIIEPNRVWHK